ncbi:YncE family protein [Phenylobacterium sp.]|uniref:YncE family protein n=1 Tax=Phenylobacterium sp. TaxID=1871053 RepID=UPI00286C33B2|nr:YncE family protein [Phenylobacterium sp.]
MSAPRVAARFAALGLASLALSGAAQAAGSGYRVLDRISGPDGGWDYVRVDSVSNRVLVAHGGSVLAMDIATKALTPGLAPGPMLHDPLPVNGGAEIMVTNGGSASAVFIDARTGAEVARVKTGVGPDAATFDPHSGLVLVMDHVAGDVTLIDPKAHKAVGSIAVGGALEAAAVDGSGRAFVNVENKNEIVVLDIAQRKVVARYPLAGCDGPTGLAYDADGKQLIATCDGSTVVLAAPTGKIVATLATGKGADGVAFDAKARLAFVPAGREGTLSVVAVGKGKAAIVDTVPTQAGARTIALDPRSGRLYLPAAEYGSRPAGGGRPPMLPGSFKILVVGK